MKNIGVCISLTHAEITREFVDTLYTEATKEGYRLICFNSILDRKYDDAKGGSEIFHMIPYDQLDALVVLHGAIRDEDLLEEIKDCSEAAGIPVIMAREDGQGMLSVSGQYEQAFSQLIRHLVLEHQAKDLFYISGRSKADIEQYPQADSAIRYHILVNTLQELGIPFDDSHMACGEYWEHPTMQVIDAMVASREKMPDAIICANDIMAMAVCGRLEEHGFHVPEDIIVTGFDGLQCARFANPTLTTCSDDIAEMGRLIVDVIKRQKAEPSGAREEHETMPTSVHYQYRLSLGESCGCGKCVPERTKEQAQLFKAFRINEADEDRTNRWISNLHSVDTLEYYKEHVPFYFTKEQLLLLLPDQELLENDGERREKSIDSLMQVVTNLPSYQGIRVASLEDIYHYIFSGEDSKGIYVLSTIFAKDMIRGIYLEKIRNMYEEGATYHRHVYTVGMTLHSCLTKEHHDSLKKDVERNRFVDDVTKLPNLRGFQHDFDVFSSKEENHQRYWEYCIFAFMNHDEILAEYRTDGVEKSLAFIADALLASHPEGTYVARISTTGFVVILGGTTAQNREDNVWDSVGKFYVAIQNHNTADMTGPQIEVSSGSIDLNPGWRGDYATFNKSGYMELYKNRAAFGQKTSKEKMDLEAENDKLFALNRIIRDKLLTYHFQPIVNAHTGTIEAYEALMRVTGGIQMNPLELLGVAKRHRMLHYVESLTMFGILDTYVARIQEFGDKKLFINTIPGNFLEGQELERFVASYKRYLRQCVIEITEDNSITMAELTRIKTMGGDKEIMKIAIDDYGTGHSNIMSVLQYFPQIIKIDRFLITDIHKDKNKQMFVSSIVSFARDNEIKILAEGIETKEELEMAIELGVDYLQGYYLAKPSAEVVQNLQQHLVMEIQDINRDKFL